MRKPDLLTLWLVLSMVGFMVTVALAFGGPR
jgi:hypothetical protein